MKSPFRCCATALALLLVALAAGCDRHEAGTDLSTSVRTSPSTPPVAEPAPELLSSQAAFIEVSQKVTPAVVNIRAARVLSSGNLNPLFEEYFGELFKHAPQLERKEQSLGSGFLISKDGYILTNEHVVKGAEEISVRLSDQRVYQAKIVGIDPRTDVAVVKIDADVDLSTVVFGDSDQIKVGQWALAIGNPFGLDRTLTVGVISATGRANVGIEDYEDFIQTDASINPGNSGGPLLNIYGEVIGVNTAIVASGQGIGFAIPSNLARLIAGQLIEKGDVTRGWLGVSIQPMTAELADSFGLDRMTGALINQVLPDSPAEAAGIKRGDVLLSLAGKEVRGVRELQLLVASTPVGNTVEVGVLRDGERMTLSVTIAAVPDQVQMSGAGQGDSAGKGVGLRVKPDDEGRGLLIEEVDPESAAARAGVQPGDLLLSVNRREVRNLQEFQAALKQSTSAKQVLLLIQRGETTLYLAFPAE